LTRSAPLRRLYLPIETKNRELDARLLLASVAAQRHWSVVVGEKSELYRLLPNLRPGVVIAKSIQKGSQPRSREFKAAGHTVCASCEEGLMFFTPEDYGHRKTGRESLAEVDRFFAWGQKHADALAHVYPELRSKVVVTGNARIDLTRKRLHRLYDEEVAEIRSKWGQFYLLNTKFARSNYIKRGPGFVEGYIQKGHAPTEAQVRLMRKSVHQEEEVLRHFTEFVRRFAIELPEKRLVIRPHPAEDFSLWERVANGLPNVSVVHQGNILPWLLASELSISNNCTSSVEAFLLGKPGINFRPFEDEEVEYVPPRIVAYQLPSTDALIQALGRTPPTTGLSLPNVPGVSVADYLANLDSTLAAEAIVLELERLDPARTSDSDSDRLPGPWVDWRDRARAMVSGLANADSKARQRLKAQKFPGMTTSELLARASRMCNLLDLGDVDVRHLIGNVFAMEAKG